MNTAKIMELIAEGATIEGMMQDAYLVHPSFRKGKRKIGSMMYWAVVAKCQKEKITFPRAAK
jgi:hypothetical protein